MSCTHSDGASAASMGLTFWSRIFCSLDLTLFSTPSIMILIFLALALGFWFPASWKPLRGKRTLEDLVSEQWHAWQKGYRVQDLPPNIYVRARTGDV